MTRSLLEATDEEILQALALYNWPAGRGHFWTAEHEQNYRRGLAEAKQILGAQPMPLPYNPDARVDVQDSDYTCALESVGFLLRSIGRNPSREWLKQQLVPALISPSAGLLDGTGQQLADWVNREYGDSMGFRAMASPVTFDDVAAGAGQNPTIIGGHRWGPAGHWSGIRRRLPDGSIELANPAPNYGNTGASLDRAEWDARAPWHAIWIDRTTAPVTPPAPQPSRAQTLVAEIEARLAELKTLVA